MRFTFPFETLLNMKKNLEELSQMRLAKKMNQLREQEEAIQRVIEEILSNEQALKEKIGQGMKASEYIVYKVYEEDRTKDLQLKEEVKKQTIKETEAEQENSDPADERAKDVRTAEGETVEEIPIPDGKAGPKK